MRVPLHYTLAEWRTIADRLETNGTAVEPNLPRRIRAIVTQYEGYGYARTAVAEWPAEATLIGTLHAGRPAVDVVQADPIVRPSQALSAADTLG